MYFLFWDVSFSFCWTCGWVFFACVTSFKPSHQSQDSPAWESGNYGQTKVSNMFDIDIKYIQLWRELNMTPSHSTPFQHQTALCQILRQQARSSSPNQPHPAISWTTASAGQAHSAISQRSCQPANTHPPAVSHMQPTPCQICQTRMAGMR